MPKTRLREQRALSESYGPRLERRRASLATVGHLACFVLQIQVFGAAGGGTPPIRFEEEIRGAGRQQ